MRCACVAFLLFVAQSAWAKPYTATVTVNCRVVGATVSVDGVDVGKTPLPPLVLSAGIHTIRVVRAGIINFSQEFMLRAGDDTVIIAAPKTISPALDFDLDIDSPPAKHAPMNELDLDLDDLTVASPAPMPPVEENLPPPPVPEPLPLPKITVRRVEPPPADPMPAPAASSPRPPLAEKEKASSVGKPPKFVVSVGLLGSVGGMSAVTPHGLSVPDTGSGVLGGLVVGEYAHWEGRLALRHVFQDRWLAANVRSGGAWEGSLHGGRWLLSPTPNVLLGVLLGAAYRSHGAPDGAWWADRGPSPSEWRMEAVPSAVWRVANSWDVTVSLPFGYGSGSVDARAWRNFAGMFAGAELAVRHAFTP